jgi:FkbM family methyltransferase
MIESLISKLKLDKLNFKDINVILEVGSRDGKQAIELSMAFPEAKVIAIEGNPDTIDQLKQNVVKFKNITPVEAIVNNYDGLTTFYKIDRENTITPHLDGNPGASSLYLANPEYPNEKYVQIAIEKKCKTLKTICESQKIFSIDLIWIDLQGSEIKALEGLKDFLKSVQYIWVEITHKPLYLDQPLFPEFDLFMNESGFELLTPIHPEAFFEDALYRRKNLKPVKENAVVLMQPWGGLGDNLQFSTLPESFSKIGRPFYISNKNICRNQEIEDLVWAKNPFVTGISTQEPNIGSMIKITDGNEPSYVERIELVHGLEAENIAPKIFHNPTIVTEALNRVLIDLSASGLGGGEVRYVRRNLNKIIPKNFITRFFCNSKFLLKDALQVKFTNYLPNKNIDLENCGEINCSSLEEYVSLLYSCETFLTVHSGAHSLAVAIKNMPGSKLKKIYCIVPRNQYEIGLFIYKDVDYLYL